MENSIFEMPMGVPPTEDELKLKWKEHKDCPFHSEVVIFSPDRKEILLGKRWEDGIWTSTGGGANAAETPKECVIRECFEETGIKLFPEDLRELTPIEFPKRKNNGKYSKKKKHTCFAFMVVLPIKPEIVTPNQDADHEIEQWQWCKLDEPLPQPIDQNRAKIISNARMKLEGMVKAEDLSMKKAIAHGQPGPALNTSDYSIDEMASKNDKLCKELETLMEGYSFGDNPRELDLASHKLSLVKVDDGFYSGSVRVKEDQTGNSGDVVHRIEKMTIPSMVQTLKAKGYVHSEPELSPVQNLEAAKFEQIEEVAKEHFAAEASMPEGSPQEQTADADAYKQVKDIIESPIKELRIALEGKIKGDIHIHLHKSLQDIHKAIKPVGSKEIHEDGHEYVKIDEKTWRKIEKEDEEPEVDHESEKQEAVKEAVEEAEQKAEEKARKEKEKEHEKALKDLHRRLDKLEKQRIADKAKPKAKIK